MEQSVSASASGVIDAQELVYQSDSGLQRKGEGPRGCVGWVSG